MKLRPVTRIIRGQATLDGAGVRLTRIFGHRETESLDPFLLLDAFGSDDPDAYMAGFPWHPHRGIETVTYMLEGSVRHRDSLGNSGVIGPGDLQWMTAGSGIIHEEMPERSPRGVHGFQLWVNLPAQDKMTAPRYRDVLAATVPVVRSDGATVRVICGRFASEEGPIRGIIGEPTYLDVQLEPDSKVDLAAHSGATTFAFVFEGSAAALTDPGGSGRPEKEAPAATGLLFGEGDTVRLRSGSQGGRFIFLGGLPLREGIAWRGPIVMNTEAELDLAFAEYRAGTFIKSGRTGNGSNL